jgi:hypothetical protein
MRKGEEEGGKGKGGAERCDGWAKEEKGRGRSGKRVVGGARGEL